MIDSMHGKWVSFTAQGKEYVGRLLTSNPQFTTILRADGKRVAIPTEQIGGVIEEVAPPKVEVP